MGVPIELIEEYEKKRKIAETLFRGKKFKLILKKMKVLIKIILENGKQVIVDIV